MILPPPSPLQKSHYDLALLNFAVRNVANYSPPVLPLDDGQPSESEIFLRLAALLFGAGVDADLDSIDDSGGEHDPRISRARRPRQGART